MFYIFGATLLKKCEVFTFNSEGKLVNFCRVFFALSSDGDIVMTEN